MKTRLGASVGVIACAIAAASAPTALGAQAPTYKVLDGTLDKTPMAKLAKLLHIPNTKIGGDNVLNFLSQSYLDLPMKPVAAKPGDPVDEAGNPLTARAFDLPAMSKIKPAARGKVEDVFRTALDLSNALPPGSDIASDFTHFGMSSPEGQNFFDLKIDTHVWDDLSLNGVPLVGPGAQIEASFDPKGALSSLTYAAREVKKSTMATLRPASDAIQEITDAYAGWCPDWNGKLDLKSKLVYYAPDMSLAVKRIFPHYEISGTMTLGDQTMDVRKVFVPAVDDGPQVQLTASGDGAKVTANATVTGGSGPYTYSWSSCDGLSPTEVKPTDSTITYNAVTREGGPAQEVVSLLVTDANGLTTRKAVKIDLTDTDTTQSSSQGTRSVKAKAASTSRNDIGVDYIGQSGGLPGSATSAAGWVNRWSQSGVPSEFSWGDGNSWETDFEKFNNTDDSVVDNVDDAFYTGHANGNGWVVGYGGDKFVDYNETMYGNKDLEWLHIAACGPLEGIKTGDIGRWWSTFQGLHILQGYATVTYDNTTEGPDLANYERGGWKIRDAWAQMARNAQGSNEIWGQIGLVRNDGVSNYDDQWWGKGSTGPDIYTSGSYGIWYLWGSS